MFNTALDVVVLIRKDHPKWQAGKLNGIGGHIEVGETPIAAMVREFGEETGIATTTHTWSLYCRMRGKDFEVECFAALGDVVTAASKTSEVVGLSLVGEIHIHRPDIIENLPWLIALAIDSLQDGRPAFSTIQY